MHELTRPDEACRRYDPYPPEGWVVRQSTTRPGVFYYMNTVTGETAVERPAGNYPRLGGAAYQPPAPSIPNIASIWLGRDRLLEWHQRLGQRFSAAVVGFYIRFRLEDQPNGKAHYKVGRLRGITEDWHIYVDLGKGPTHRGDSTSIDCVSNSVFSAEEIRAWYEQLDRPSLPTLVSDLHHTADRLRQLEAELKQLGETPNTRRGARRPQQQPSPQQQQQQQQPVRPEEDRWAQQRGVGDAEHRWLAQRSPLHGQQQQQAMALSRSDTGLPQRSPPDTGPLTPAKPAHAIAPVTPPTPPGVGLHAHAGTPPPGLGGYADTPPPAGHGRDPQRADGRPRSRSRGGQPRGAAAPAGLRHRPPQSCQLSPVVLLIDEHGHTKGSVLISQVVSRATCVEVDTPTANAAHARPVNPFATCDVGQEQDIMGTESTILRIRELEAEPRCDLDKPPEAMRVLHMIREARVDSQTFRYSKPREFAQAVLALCRCVSPVLEREPLLVRRSSPVYIFGDIHGNWADLTYFMERLIPFGEIMYAPCDFVFLGDYVDRGTCSIECISWLLAHKLLGPEKVTLLRGNHESPEVSGDVSTYGSVSFKHQCLQIFGEDLGVQVWAGVNNLFKHMSLACILDNRIFCSHGGIPQYYGGPDARIELLEKPNFPRFDEVQSADPDPETREYRQFVSDLLWSDPAEAGSELNDHGFGENPRGPGITTFGSRAVDVFLANHNFDYIIRAHQEKANGLRLSDNARVLTVFSSSDYGGHQNGAGVLYVGGGRIRMIIKDPVPVREDENQVQHLRKAWGS